MEQSQNLEDCVNLILGQFYETVNPAINFGNKTNRTAADWLVMKFGFDKALKIATYACSVQGQRFAPVITTPYQLKEKFGALVLFKKRQEGEKPAQPRDYKNWTQERIEKEKADPRLREFAEKKKLIGNLK